jgi:hypothetical protein
MSKHHLREEKTCLNCGHHVEDHFCGHCGQENTEPRQTFGHLVTHFFEDITHYEGKFWVTLKYLFFKPAYLTKEFLAGKRNSYLPPVRLYIFVSFITFFLPHLLPHAPKAAEASEGPMVIVGDSIPVAGQDTSSGGTTFGYESGKGIVLPAKFRTITELDSAKAARAAGGDPMDLAESIYEKKAIELKMLPPEKQLDMFMSAYARNIPKALFIYMPLFALVLGLFHNRRRWIYFDHAIFTLHLFSFLLLTFLFTMVLLNITSWIVWIAPGLNRVFLILYGVLPLGLAAWYIYYVYAGNHRMYGQSRVISAAKTTGMLLMNGLLFCIISLALAVITLFTMH